MKKTQGIDLWTTIGRNKVPYIAIVIFVALGIALFGGMSWAYTSINTAITETCADTCLANMRVVYAYGISDAQIDELKQIDGVDDAEGYNCVYRFFEQDGVRRQAIIYQLTERISAVETAEGTLPEAADEIAVLRSWAESNNVHIGDTITFLEEYGSDYRQLRAVTAVADWDPDSGEQPDTDTSDPGYLKTTTFTVTALVDSSEYLMNSESGYGSNSMNGINVNAVMFVSKKAMDPEKFNGYTMAAIYSSALSQINDDSEEYQPAYDQLQASVEAVTETWSSVPDGYSSAVESFGQKLEDAAEQIRDAEEQIEQKQKELEQGQQTITSGERTLAEKEEEYNAGKAQYDAKRAEADSAAAELADKWGQYNILVQDVNAVTDLKNALTAFSQIKEEPDQGDPDAKAEKLRTAADAVRTAARTLYDLISTQEQLDRLASLAEAQGITIDTATLKEYVLRLANSTTNEEIQKVIDEIGDWPSDVFSLLESLPPELYSQLSSAQAQLDDANSQLNAAAAQLSDGLEQLEAGRAQLASARSLLASGKQELSKARTQLAEKQKEYDEAVEQYREMEAAEDTVYTVEPVVFTRTSNISLASADGVRNVILKARSNLASVFLIVAVLVGYSTLARMVADSTLQLGTKKALGFTRREALRLYLLYAVTATLLGGLLGTAGAYGVEVLFRMVFVSMFRVKMSPPVIQLWAVLLPLLAELALLTLAAGFASFRQLNRKAIDLLNGNTETGKRKNRPLRFPLFRKMPLLDQIILANLRQDKRRVAAMLIGIGGSAMLITAGLTCQLNMSRSIDLQFSRYYEFDTIIRYDPSDENASAELRALLDRYGVDYAEIYHTHMLTNDNNGVTRIPDVFVPTDTEELSQVMHFENEDGQSTAYTGGLWVAASYSGKQGMVRGETIVLQTLEGSSAELPITGFYRNYLPSLIMVVDLDTWQSAFPGTEPNAFLVSTDGIDTAALQEELNNTDGYLCSIAFRSDLTSAFSSILMVITACTGVFSGMAAILMLMLLINLLDMYIAEKKRELIILKINGYPGKTARQYIWKDTVILITVGILIGVILGSLEGNLTQASLEGAEMLLYHGISWIACGVAAGAAALLALLITLGQLRKVDRFRLSDINS